MITEEDLKIIKEFIDTYEQVEKENKQYISICESIRKNGLFQKYNNEDPENYSMEEIFKIIELNELKRIDKEKDINRKKLLIDQLNELKKMIEYAKDYKEIGENYKQIFKFEDIKENEEEPPTKEYNKNEPLPQREYILNKNMTITQIYKRIKELYTYCTNKNDVKLDEIFDDKIKTYFIYKEDILKYINKIKMETQNINKYNYEQTIRIERTK